MYKLYYSDEERVEYVRGRMGELKIQPEYQDYVADILLRKAYEYELTDEEVKEDIDTLIDSLQEIVVEEAPKGSYNSWGSYFAEFKKILINDRTLVEATSEKIYGTFAHEVYHALTHDMVGNDRIEWLNPITQERTASLREAIVETASARTIQATGISKENPYYNNYTTGYSSTTFIIPLISAVMGVKEKELLKYAMKSDTELKHYLCRKDLCDKGETQIASKPPKDMLYSKDSREWNIYFESLKRQTDFLNILESNLSMIHNALHRESEEPLNKKELNDWIRDGFSGICNACADMLKLRAEMCIDDKSMQDSLKFSYNQMYFIIDEAYKKFASGIFNTKTAEEMTAMLDKQKKEVFNVVAQKVGVRTPRRSERFVLTDDMLKFADIPDEEEKEWQNKKRAEEFKKLVKSRKITVYRDRRNDDVKKVKGYYRHSYYRFLTDFMIGRMDLPKGYKSILADVMLRRGYQYRQEPEEMMEDLERLYGRLGSIDVTLKDEGYDPLNRKINIKGFSLFKEPKSIYEGFSLQIYKMLAGENPKEDKNDIAYNSILERAVHRTIYDKPKTHNPYYNNVGVSDQVNLAVELVSLAYGIPEKDLLTKAINGKKEFLESLSESAEEPIEKTKEFWKKLNRNLLIVNDLKIVGLGEAGEEKKENDQDFVDGVSNLINLCVEKREELLDRVISSDEEGLSPTGMNIYCDEMKFSYNAIKKLSSSFAINKKLSKRIQNVTKDSLGRFRAKIEATSEAVSTMEEAKGSIKRLRESNYGLDSCDTQKSEYFELDPVFIEEIAKTKPDEKSWGRSLVFDDTRLILIEKSIVKGLGKLKEFFIKPTPSLNGGGEIIDEEDIPERITFEEDLKVDFTDDKQISVDDNSKRSHSSRKEENER